MHLLGKHFKIYFMMSIYLSLKVKPKVWGKKRLQNEVDWRKEDVMIDGHLASMLWNFYYDIKCNFWASEIILNLLAFTFVVNKLL